MTRDTSMRQRPRRRYQFSQHGQSEQGQRAGNYLIVNNQADLWSPAYGAGVTTIRIFPGLCLENPNEWDPYRFPSTDQQDPLGFGDWIRRYPAVRSMGDPPVTFVQFDPADPLDDPQMTPGWMLFRAIDRAVAAGQDRAGWASLLRGSAGRGAQLSKPSEVYLVQCVVCQYKNRPYNPPKGFGSEDRLVVMELGPSAGMAMIQEMHREVEGYQGDPDDFEHRYVNGDPISLHNGRFINFYTLKDGDPRQMQQTGSQGWNMGGQQGGQTSGRGGQQDPIGYGCFMEPTFGGVPANFTQYEPFIHSRVRSWDDIIRVPTLEEQAHLLADKFPPEVIEYAWSARPEWIPEEVRRRARAVHTMTMPQNTPEGGFGQNGGFGGAAAGFVGGAQGAQGAHGARYPGMPTGPVNPPGTQQAVSGAQGFPQQQFPGQSWGQQAQQATTVPEGSIPPSQAEQGSQGQVAAGWPAAGQQPPQEPQQQPQGQPAQQQPQGQPAQQPPQQPPQQPTGQPPQQPQGQPGQQQPQQGAPSGMMAWGMQNNPAQQQMPQGAVPASDAMPPGMQQPPQQGGFDGVPPTQTSQPPQQPPQQPVGSDITPPENAQPQQQFDQRPAPAPSGTMTAAQQALARAQQARANQS